MTVYFLISDHDQKRYPRRIEEDKNRNRFVVVNDGEDVFWLMKPITLSPISGHNSSNPFLNNKDFQPEKNVQVVNKSSGNVDGSKSDTKGFIPQDSFDSFVR